MAEGPGTISGRFRELADREAAFRFVENDEVSYESIVEAGAGSSMARAAREGLPFVIAPVDGSSLSLGNRATEEGGFGPVGTAKTKTLGLESMNCVLVSPKGVVLGVGGQKFWARSSTRKKKKPQAGKRPLSETENAYWLEVMEQALAAQQAQGAQATKLWFQLDRGGDARELLFWASNQACWVTIRAAQDRRVSVPEEGLLWSTLEKQSPAGSYPLEVAGSPTRKPRTAKIEVRFTSVLLPLRNGWSKHESPAPLHVVYAKEVSDPLGDAPIEWMLLTNREVLDLDTARQVISGYAMRWRVEEVHRTWKTTCKIEESALESAGNLMRWAAIQFAVAARIERLKRLARTEPGAGPATEEFEDDELEALIALRDPKLAKGTVPTLAQAVRWLADLGGYAGPSSSGPPGAVTLARGLQAIAPAVRLLSQQRKK